MLSYQHIYHAGNAADVQKHALLAFMLAYLTRKDKPLSYIETHAGRGLYRIDSQEARKTGEAGAGIGRLAGHFAPDHPYRRLLDKIAREYGGNIYPGSPLIAAQSLRPSDSIHLAELHPREFDALAEAMNGSGAQLYKEDGLKTALSLSPPSPRRGLMLIDPSWELKDEYQTMPRFIAKVRRKWNVGVIALWYPLLESRAHEAMLDELSRDHPDALRHEVSFPPVREGHRMQGSGMFIINPPWGLEEEAAAITRIFSALS